MAMGKASRVGFVALMVMVAAAVVSAPARGLTDTTPPELTNFTVSQTSVQPTTSPAGLTFVIEGTDDFPRGLCTSTSVRFTPASGRWIETIARWQINANRLEGGMSWDPGAEAGDWNITLFLRDCQEVVHTYSTADLAALGFPSNITVLPSAADTTPPTLTNLTFSKTAIQPTDLPDSLSAVIEGTDDFPRGLCFGTRLRFTAPSGFWMTSGLRSASPPSPNRLEGGMSWNPGAEPGEWRVSLDLMDCQENVTTYSSSDLAALGFPSVVTVGASGADTTPPTLTNFTLDKVVLNPVTAPDYVEAFVEGTDDFPRGLCFNTRVRFTAPSGWWSEGGDFATSPPSPNRLRVVNQWDPGAEPGRWDITISLADCQGNVRVYPSAELLAMGLPDHVTVLGEPPNSAPVATDDTYAVAAGEALQVATPGVLTNDTDPDNDELSASAVTAPLHGTVALATDGSFVYTPASRYVGPDSFTYVVSDGEAQSAAATVNITVRGVYVDYEGPAAVKAGGSFNPKAKVRSDDAACLGDRVITFTLNQNPTNGQAGPYVVGRATTSAPSGQATAPAVSTAGWKAGNYTITASVDASGACRASTDTAAFKVSK
jgi:hypothetical protein